MHGDEIRLALPAEPAYGRIARIAASGLALRLGLGYTEVEDLRLAIDETLILLLRPGHDGERITFTFTVEPTRLLVDAVADVTGVEDGFDQAALARFEEIVGDTVDSYAVDGGHVRLEKARPTPAA